MYLLTYLLTCLVCSYIVNWFSQVNANRLDLPRNEVFYGHTAALLTCAPKSTARSRDARSLPSWSGRCVD